MRVDLNTNIQTLILCILFTQCFSKVCLFKKKKDGDSAFVFDNDGGDCPECRKFFFKDIWPKFERISINWHFICQYYKDVPRFFTLYDIRYRMPLFSAYRLNLKVEETPCSADVPCPNGAAGTNAPSTSGVQGSGSGPIAGQNPSSSSVGSGSGPNPPGTSKQSPTTSSSNQQPSGQKRPASVQATDSESKPKRKKPKIETSEASKGKGSLKGTHSKDNSKQGSSSKLPTNQSGSSSATSSSASSSHDKGKNNPLKRPKDKTKSEKEIEKKEEQKKMKKQEEDQKNPDAGPFDDFDRKKRNEEETDGSEIDVSVDNEDGDLENEAERITNFHSGRAYRRNFNVKNSSIINSLYDSFIQDFYKGYSGEIKREKGEMSERKAENDQPASLSTKKVTVKKPKMSPLSKYITESAGIISGDSGSIRTTEDSSGFARTNNKRGGGTDNNKEEKKKQWKNEPQLEMPNDDSKRENFKNMAKTSLKDEFPVSPQKVDRQPQSSNFENSGWDRGHLNPNRFQVEDDSEATYTLTNAVPQYPGFNSGYWCELEQYTLQAMKTFCKKGKPYLITGATPSLTPKARELDIGTKQKSKLIVIPLMLYTAACCDKGADSFSFGFYGTNEAKPKIGVVKVEDLISIVNKQQDPTDRVIFTQFFPGGDDNCKSDQGSQAMNEIKKKVEEMQKKRLESIIFDESLLIPEPKTKDGGAGGPSSSTASTSGKGVTDSKGGGSKRKLPDHKRVTETDEDVVNLDVPPTTN